MSEANRHSGDINFDTKFDCKNNCPYCNDYVIHIQLLSIYPSVNCLHYNDEIYKKYICLRCGKEFWEVYYFINDGEDYDWCIDVFELSRESGNMEDVAEYICTILEKPQEEEQYLSELHPTYKYPGYRRLMPEEVDIFEPGPIEHRSEILDLGDKSNSFGFLYFNRG